MTKKMSSTRRSNALLFALLLTLSSANIAKATNLELIVQDQTPSARFSFHHEATVGALFTPVPTGPAVEFFTTGSTTQITSESAIQPFNAAGDDSNPAGPTFSGFAGAMNLGNGSSIVFSGGSLDFTSINHDGSLVGGLPYVRYGGADGTGSILDSGTYYAYDFDFGAGDAPQSFTGSLSSGEFHLWMNNWDNVKQSKADFLLNGDINDTARYKSYQGDAQGLDLAIAIRVPDGGLSVILLGLGLVGTGLFQRFSKK